VFDGDQTSMNGQFNLGTTYRNNSAVTTGLNFGVSTPWANSGFVATDIVNQTSVTFRTATFQFAGGLFNNTVFEFDADTDGGPTNATGGMHAGMVVQVTLSDATVFTGNLVLDPANAQRSFIEFN
jgi:hypothetical protein